MVGASVQAHWRLNDRSGSDDAKRFAEMVFDHLPPGAMLFTYADSDSVPLGYFRFVEQFRPDVTLMSTQGLIFENHPYHWRVPEAQKKEILSALVNETGRPVLFINGQLMASLGFAVRFHGFIQEIIDGEERVELSVQARAMAYFDGLLRHRSHDRWERNERNMEFGGFGRVLGLAVFSGDTAFLEQLRRPLAQAEQNFFTLVGMAEMLAEYGNAAHDGQIEAWLEKAESLQDDTVNKKIRARLLYLRGFL